MKLGELIKERRKALKWTQADLASRINISRGRIAQIEKDPNTTVQADTLLSLSRALNCHVDVLMSSGYRRSTSQPAQQISENTSPYLAQTQLIPVISWVNAGAFCEAVDEFAPGDAEEWLPCPSNVGPRAYALRVQGDSMTSPYPGQRSYPAGTIIFVDPERAVTNGARVIAKLVGSQEVTFKVYAEDAGKRFLKPINPQYPILEITEETHICGVVAGSYWPE
tara:strand:+ start:31417 stop:32085 length:669 start_codon:yes stop_codon:yes gene_type:complete